MSHFLIVYDRSSGLILRETEYPDDQRDSALLERAQLELEHGADNGVEVVVLGARNHSELERTHSRYFKTLRGLAST